MRRAKTSRIGSVQILPEPRRALLPRPIASRGPRRRRGRVGRLSSNYAGERFLKARRAEDITEEALVVVGRRLLHGPRVRASLATPDATAGPRWRPSSGVALRGTGIGSELFLAGGAQNSTYICPCTTPSTSAGFTIPLSSKDPTAKFSAPKRLPSAVPVVYMWVICSLPAMTMKVAHLRTQSWDPDAQRWMDMPQRCRRRYRCDDTVIRINCRSRPLGSGIFILDRMRSGLFSRVRCRDETWSSRYSYWKSENPRHSGMFIGSIRDTMAKHLGG